MVNLEYLYNPDAAKGFIDKNYFVDKKLGLQVIENGIALPHKKTIDGQPLNKWGYGGVVDSEGKFVRGSSLNQFDDIKSYTPPHRIYSTPF